MQVAFERVGDPEQGVDPRRPAAALEPRDRRLRRPDALGELALGETSLDPTRGDCAGDRGEEPSLLGPREPGAEALERE